MNYGVIGTGWIAEAFVGASRLVDGMNAAAVYSRTEEHGKVFAEKNGIGKIYTDINKLAADSEIDAVYIASPNVLHYPQSKLFLESGKHVICEKPITVTPAQLSELIKLADSRFLIYMEAIMMLHSPNLQALKNAAASVGKIRTAHFDFSQLSSKYASLVRGDFPNIFNPEMATGCLMDLGIYCVYPAINFWGYPDSISASAGFLETGADGWGTAVFHYSDKDVTLTYSKVGQDRCGSQIFGDKGTVSTSSISMLTGIKLFDNDGNASLICGEEERRTVMGYEARAFYSFITEPDKYRTEYKKSHALAYDVSRTMEEIRNLSGIKFR